MTETRRGSDRRLREVVLYVLQRRGRKVTTTEWLLNFLFLADREAYLRLGRSITGKTYRKMPAGPTPSRFGHVMASMVREGDVRLTPLPARDARGWFTRSPTEATEGS